MTNDQFELLLQLTSIRSDDIKAAARAVLVDGETQKAAASSTGVNEGQLSRRLSAIREAEDVVIALSKFYQKG